MDTILTHKKLLLNNTRSFLDVVKVGTYNKGLYSLTGWYRYTTVQQCGMGFLDEGVRSFMSSMVHISMYESLRLQLHKM